MNKFKYVLYISLIISVIGASIFGVNIKQDSYSYMTKEQVDKAIANEFYAKTAQILMNVGTIASFDDTYGNDDNIVPHTDGYTVGELKDIYKNDKNVVQTYREYLDNIFYYSDEMDEEEQEDNLDGTSKGVSDYIAKFGFSSYDKYIEEQNKATALYNFFTFYSQIYEIENGDKTPTNLDYIISYTDTYGNVKRYTSYNADLIIQNKSKYQSNFLFDRKNNMIDMENIDKEYANYSNLVYKCKTFSDYNDFYAYFAINSDYPYNDEFSHYANEVISDNGRILKHNLYVASMIICIIIYILAFMALTSMTDNKNKPSYLQSADRIWWDFALVVIVAITYWVIYKFNTHNVLKIYTDKDYVVTCALVDLLAIVISFIWFSVVRRYKDKSLWQSSLTGTIILKLIKIGKLLGAKMSATWKTIIIAILSLAAAIGFGQLYSYGILFGRRLYFYALIIYCMAILAVIAFFSWMFFSEYSDVAVETKKIAEGEVYHKIKRKLRFKSNIKMADSVNSIGDGISSAVEKSIKNERLKTDLITNVSHDIKTPLTSIINYVNLLKMEEPENEKTKEYLRILDDKSQRLKVLIDDLVEASKLSSGVIEMNMTKMNLVELIKQSAGEFEEKFESCNLEVVMNLPNYPVYVNADGRKMWRVLENLYGNICKYAMPGTRVYADLTMTDKKVIFVIKNISQKAMKFDSNDLTERFIRGDVSRSTEGSGLGLSIAKTIIDRHNGEFKIILDGDLFKAMVILDNYDEDVEE